MKKVGEDPEIGSHKLQPPNMDKYIHTGKKKTASSINGVGKLEIHILKNSARPVSLTMYRN